ncbi:MAG TPA: succinate:quinone oxidoreductase [Planctomycetaceae bacterium]|nr:succinate:quinone oxidoreductase [Planctomycetaceae bacterium]
MKKLIRLLDSSVGQKLIAGATGIALVGFLVVHMAGNLQIFAGANSLNAYAALLKSQAIVLWSARLGLLVLIGLHIAMTVRQVIRNRGQKSKKYATTNYRRTTVASRSMMLTGSVLLGFIVFHLLHFTGGVILPEAYQQTDSEGRHNVFAMVVDGFRHPIVLAVYLAGMAALATHLHHAISSVWQTLGLARDGCDSRVRKLSPILAAVIIAGFLLVPLSIVTGFVGK